jgi:hypothetical protein
MQRSALNNKQSTANNGWRRGALTQIASSFFSFLRLSLPSPSTGTEGRQEEKNRRKKRRIGGRREEEEEGKKRRRGGR